ncbi:MAG TPA: hypothetical protein VKH19_02725 [Gemmatimonadaceae bacterium]|nr:hypothetical protein [Gemmatimonadaceae bacterium]
MILANARHQLSRHDAQLAVRLVAHDSAEEFERAQQRLVDEGLDAILDDRRLPGALLASRFGAYASMPLFLYVMVRHTLLNAGERDRGLSDYLAAILLAFGGRGAAERISSSDDELYDTLASLLDDVNDSDPRRAFLVRAHLGNRALWIAGLFPDYVEQRKWRRGGPDLSYFDELGKRGFELAAEHRLAEQYGMSDTYATIAARFGLLRVALNSISDRLFFPNVNTPERLMRQVEDEARWRLAG